MNLIKFFQTVLHELRELWQTPVLLSMKRQFGYVVGTCAIGLGVLFVSLHSSSSVTYGLLGVGTLLVLIARVEPLMLSVPYKIWMSIALVLSFLVSPIILLLLFFVAVTPVGLLQRLFSGDPLKRKFEPKEKTYFVKHADQAPDHMQQPF